MFHGQHQQIVGTALVVADTRQALKSPAVTAAVAAPTPAPAPAVAPLAPVAVALTSRRIVFKLASGRIDSLLARVGGGGGGRPLKKAKV